MKNNLFKNRWLVIRYRSRHVSYSNDIMIYTLYDAYIIDSKLNDISINKYYRKIKIAQYNELTFKCYDLNDNLTKIISTTYDVNHDIYFSNPLLLPKVDLTYISYQELYDINCQLKYNQIIPNNIVLYLKHVYILNSKLSQFTKNEYIPSLDLDINTYLDIKLNDKFYHFDIYDLDL